MRRRRLIEPHRVLAAVLNAGTGEDIVEVGEERVSPSGLIRLKIISRAENIVSERGERRRLDELRLGHAVGSLYPRLGRVAAVKEEVQLMVDDGQLFAYLRLVGNREELTEGAESHLRPDLPALHLDRALNVASRDAAAVVSDAVDDKPGLKPAHAARQIDEPRTDVRRYSGIVPVRLAVHQYLSPGRSLVTIKNVIPVKPAAVIVVLYPGKGVDLRNMRAVPEGIG